MSERNLKQLQPILKNLDGGAWSRLEPFHLSVFRSMYARRINYPFLHVVAEFWDSNDHVFRFNTVELCPLPEEFEAILGSQSDSACQIATPLLEILIRISFNIKWQGCSISHPKHRFITCQVLKLT